MRGYYNKKIACLFCASIMIVTSLAGCGGNVENDESSSQVTVSSMYESSYEDTTKIGEDVSSQVIDTEELTSQEMVSEDETAKEEMTTEVTSEETTTKVPVTTEATTTKKPADKTTEKVTKDTTKKTTQKTTSKPKPEEQTTAAPKVSKAEKMAKEIVEDIITSKMTEFDKALAIHDWLIFNLDYDFTYSNYYVEETLTDRKCVCQGYALTFKMMCEMAGLEVIFVTGEGYSGGAWGGHAWNQVKISGKWYNVDVTWDDPASPGKDFNDHGGNRHDYFLISDARINKDHRANSSGRKTCSSDYDRVAIAKAATNNVYHSSFGFATNAEEMATAINKLVEANNSKIYIKYYDPNLTLDNMWNGIMDKLKLAKYPIIGGLSAYPPVDGIGTYVLNVIPLKEWNKITVITSEEQLNELMDTTYNSGKKTLTVRYEPADGNVWFYSEKYIFTQKDRSEYNGGKAIYTTIEINGLQEY